MTRDELKAVLVRRIIPKLRANLVWQDITAAVAASTAADRLDIVNHVRAGNARLLGDKLGAMVATYLQTKAGIEADTMLADDSLSLAELERVL